MMDPDADFTFIGITGGIQILNAIQMNKMALRIQTILNNID